MKASNYHTHTTYCDGADSPEELVLEAIRLGCPEIGFSGHSCLREDSGSMSISGTKEYCTEIRRLQQKYQASIRILLGIEQDYYSDPVQRNTFDYVIGAVHYVENAGVLYPVDESRDSFIHTAQSVYGGDYYAFAEDYYRTVSQVVRRTRCSVIAHFDLISKYNEGDALFDSENPRYVAATDSALDELLQSDALLEINTGAMARGYRSCPYPENRILNRWLNAGKPVLLSSDCHDKRMLLYGFEDIRSRFPDPDLLLERLPLNNTQTL